MRLAKACLLAAAVVLAAQGAASASAVVVVDAESGNVLYQDNATAPWFPASTTKLMTVYVALSAVREGRITLDTPMMVSSRAASMAPSKMGFRPGTLVTLDNALKMLMVKSPNDVAVTIAEGVSGSVEAFANDMNVYATRLGLHESHFVNPNGLPDDRHVSSARDMAMIGRALLRDFPEERGLFSIGALAFGGRIINNHNGLLGRYPGADGMKTGFTCAAGYNVVASAERDGRHLITVIMGAPSTGERNMRAAALFDRFFINEGAGLGPLDTLPASATTAPVDNHATACGRGRAGAVAEAEAEDAAFTAPSQPATQNQLLAALTGQPGTAGDPAGSGLSPTRAPVTPIRVFVGPVAGWTGRVALAVGGNAREFVAAPVKQTAAAERALANPPDANGPLEGAAPGPSGGGPLALVGATQAAPAAAATGRLVRAAPGLGLAVGSIRKKGVKAAHPAAPVPPKPIAAVKTKTKPAKIAERPAATHKKPAASASNR